MGTNNLDTTVAKNVTALIHTSEKTESYISRETGIPVTSLRRKLKGDTSFTVGDLARIGQTLKFDPALFFDEQVPA